MTFRWMIPFVSEWHGIIRFTAQDVAYFDLGSTNGSILDGQRLPKNLPPALTETSRLQLGRIELSVAPPEAQEEQGPGPGMGTGVLPTRRSRHAAPRRAGRIAIRRRGVPTRRRCVFIRRRDAAAPGGRAERDFPIRFGDAAARFERDFPIRSGDAAATRDRGRRCGAARAPQEAAGGVLRGVHRAAQGLRAVRRRGRRSNISGRTPAASRPHQPRAARLPAGAGRRFRTPRPGI